MAAGGGELVVANTNLRLYSYWKSSCSFRVRIALNLKGIKYEYKAANLLKGVRSDHEFLKFNPLGYVPVLVDGDAVVADSLAIVMYLEDKYPQQHPLLPHDIHKRAINFQVAHIVSSTIQPFQGRSLLVNYIEEKVNPEEKLGCAENAIYKGFRALERLLKEHAGKYATGDEVLLADLFLAPQIHAAFTRFDIDKKKENATPKSEQKVLVGDSRHVQITTFRLNGSNYLRWSKSVQLYIRGRGKIGYLTGERSKPDITDPQHNVWEAKNSMVMAWLVNSMEEDISSNYMYYSTAKELWDSVMEMYSDLGNKSQIYELTLQAREIRQGGDNVTKYFHTLKRVWQDLGHFNTYKRNSTEDAKHHQQTVEEGRIFQFLAGLNEELDEVRGRIIGRTTLPSIGEVFSEVKREETCRAVMMGKTKAEPTSLETNVLLGEAVALKSTTNQRNSSNLWYDHCSKPRHTRETC